jgi:hypothetical protein
MVAGQEVPLLEQLLVLLFQLWELLLVLPLPVLWAYWLVQVLVRQQDRKSES